jgi:hypothetical protein
MFNQILTKFYNIDTPDTINSPSIAEMMATQGRVNTGDTQESTPVVSIPENKEEATEAESVTSVATTTDNPEAASAIQETPTPEKQTAVAPEPQKEEAPAPQVSWQEVLKQQQPNTVFKELGYDENLVQVLDAIKGEPKMQAFFQHWMQNGNVTAFLQEANTDYTKMPAEEVMRHQLKSEYPNLSDRHLQVLFEDEVLEKFKLDPEKYSEEEMERGRLLLEAKAERFRGQLIENQKNFLLPKPPEPKVEAPDNTAELQQQQVEQYKSLVNNDVLVKDFVGNKRLVFGEGEEAFTYQPQDPNKSLEVLFDSEKWAEKLFDKDGKPHIRKQLILSVLANEDEKFLKDYAAHYKAIGAKSIIAPIENVSQPHQSTPSTTEAQPKTAAEGMAKYGTRSY